MIRGRPRKDTKETLLHDRASNSFPVIVYMYVGQGDNVYTNDQYKRTPPYFVVTKGQLEDAKILIKGGAVVDAKDTEGNTPEILASDNNHPAVVDLLKNY